MAAANPKTDAEVKAYWNSDVGERWVRDQERLDEMLAVFSEEALKAARVTVGETAIDVGCGCGGTTLRLGELTRPNGSVVGLDVSEPMLARARERAKAKGLEIEFIQGDAGATPLPPQSFDLLFSRFGVMFFEKPAASFAHLRKALNPSGRVAFVCWRRFPENEWLLKPFIAASQFIAPPPRPGPEDPGPFAFGDPERVQRIFKEAGYRDLTMTPFDAELRLGRNLDDAMADIVQFGPVAALFADAPDDLKAKATDAVRKSLEANVRPDGVWLKGATWIVTARP